LRIGLQFGGFRGFGLSNTLVFTARSVDELMPTHHRNMAIFWDEKEPGLGLYVTPAGHKAYFARKKIGGKDRRLIIGSANEYTPDHAREAYRNMKQKFAAGVDPLLEKRREKRKAQTLGELHHQYMERYSKLQKKSWKHDESEIKAFLGHWFNLRLIDISRSDIRLLHEKLFKEKGPYRANRMLERIKAMYNKAIEWDWEGINPAVGIKAYTVKSRDLFVQQEEMPYLVKGIDAEPNPTVRDYLRMLLLTGARKTNMAMMRWEEVNWDAKYWRIPESKNGETLVIPLMERAITILENRRRKTNSEWVFPSPVDNARYFVSFKRAWKRALLRATLYMWAEDKRIAKIIEEANTQIGNDTFINEIFEAVEAKAKFLGIPITQNMTDIRLHDLRRTFGSYQAINGTSLHVIGQSLGHKSTKSTQIYARLTLDPVRDSMAKAIDKMIGI
jgi:integrase